MVKRGPVLKSGLVSVLCSCVKQCTFSPPRSINGYQQIVRKAAGGGGLRVGLILKWTAILPRGEK